MSDLTESTIESAAGGNKSDLRKVLRATLAQFQTIAAATGVSLLAPTNSPQQPSTPPPPTSAINVTGANGTYAVAITPVRQSLSKTIYNEVSYSPSASFAQNVAILSASTALSFTSQQPGATMYWRVRSSYDQTNWSAYQMCSANPVKAGLQESAAMSSGAAFNQTNYAYVDSASDGSTARVIIHGPGGTAAAYPAVRGGSESIRPSGTVVNVAPGTDQFIGWDPQAEMFAVHPTLAQVLNDNLEPVGKVSVVNVGNLKLPSIVPVVSDGHILGFNVTSGGNGLSGNVTIEITDSAGTGATAGAQTIQNGVLIAVAPGNPGANYANPVITLGGGLYSGASGGGTALGGNGGRMSNV